MVTVRWTVAFLIIVPNVPVTVIVDFPAAAEPLTASVKTLEEVVGFVPKVAVTPVGIPVAARLTSWSKPFVGLMVIVLVPLLPCATDSAVGEALSV